MLIVQDKEYYNKVLREVQERAEKTYNMKLIAAFHAAMCKCQVYGCGWEDPEKARFRIYRDFAKWSFGFTIDFRNADGEDGYKRFCNGALIYDESDCAWGMHT